MISTTTFGGCAINTPTSIDTLASIYALVELILGIFAIVLEIEVALRVTIPW
jgi:hypothetical protein